MAKKITKKNAALDMPDTTRDESAPSMINTPDDDDDEDDDDAPLELDESPVDVGYMAAMLIVDDR